MSYILNESNFSEFTKKVAKNLKKENIEVKLSTLKEAISKSVGFNNFHCAQKEGFSISQKTIENEKIVLSPFNKKYSQLDVIFNSKNTDVFSFNKNLTLVSCNALFAALSLFKSDPELYELNMSNWINELVDRCGGFEEATRCSVFLMLIMEIRDAELGSERDILGRLLIKKIRNEVPKWIAEMFFSRGLSIFKKECFNCHFDITYIDGECEYDFDDIKSCLNFAKHNISWDLIEGISLTIVDIENEKEIYIDEISEMFTELEARI